MGGIGSGRHWQFGADTTDDYRSIDIRWLKREGLLESGISRRITWSRGGEVTGSINVQSEPGRVILDYRHRDRGGEWQPERYPVYLAATPCHMGGERPWFLCPAHGRVRRRGSFLSPWLMPPSSRCLTHGRERVQGCTAIGREAAKPVHGCCE